MNCVQSGAIQGWVARSPKGLGEKPAFKKKIYFHMKSYPSFLRMGLALAGLGLSSCAVSTPGSRVAQAPQLYQPLPAGQKTAVMEGRVVEGMPPDAVFLALGRPDRVVRGSANGTPYELWRYTELQPVYRSGFSAGYGFGYPYSRHHGYHANNWIGYETGPDYVPVTSIVVRFTRNRVSGWERLR